jgi:ATP-dependent helicase/DNAse subunit B
MGGFLDLETETEYKEKGKKMIQNVLENKGPIANKTVKFYDGDFIPNIYLSEEDNIILCGLVDWVEYLPETDSLRVIDFKTGKNDEKDDSFQLPIYKILVEALQKRKVTGAAYWYLEREKVLTKKEILDEDVEDIKEKILKAGKEIKEKKESTRSKDELEQNFACPQGGCRSCREFELIRNYTFDTDEIEYLGVGEYKQDLYLIKKN